MPVSIAVTVCPERGRGWIGADPLADLGRVGMGVPDATIVGDHDEQRAALPPDGLGPSLDQAVRIAVHDRQGDPGIGRHGLGHPQRLLLEGAVQLMAQGTQRQPKADDQGDHEDGELQPEDWVDSRRCRTTPPSPRRRRAVSTTRTTR